jgi:hypothetical protein
MSTIELTEEEIATLRQGLIAAAMRYRHHAQTALEVGEEHEINPVDARGISAQFTKQADEADALYVKLANVDKIAVTTED